MNISGVLLLDKPLGCSSNKILQKVKRLFNAKKAGHTGSLDPLATGMLPICFNEATKFSQFLLNEDKTYEVIATLGEATTTGDAEGEVIKTGDAQSINDDVIHAVLKRFVGKQLQTPSMYSALKHNGQPLYELARKGIFVERIPREITIYDLQFISRVKESLTLKVHCSKGTYIRNLVEDIGEALGCYAYVSKLHRISVGGFDENQMVSFDTLENAQNREQTILSIDDMLKNYPVLELSNEDVLSVHQGKHLLCKDYMEGMYRLHDEQHQFHGMVNIDSNCCLKSVRMMICGSLEK